MEEPKSKSQKKREVEALQVLGLQFAALSAEKLALLALEWPLSEAIEDYRLMKSHGAKRRQAQLIGKLMRQADLEDVLQRFQQMEADERADTEYFHQLEYWRDRLIAEDDAALTEFLSLHRIQEVQQLRQLLRKAKLAPEKDKTTTARALFRFLRSEMP